MHWEHLHKSRWNWFKNHYCFLTWQVDIPEVWLTWRYVVTSFIIWAGDLIAHLLAQRAIFQSSRTSFCPRLNQRQKEGPSCLQSIYVFNKKKANACQAGCRWCNEMPSQEKGMDTARPLIRHSQHLHFTSLHSWNLATWSLKKNNCFLKITLLNMYVKSCCCKGASTLLSCKWKAKLQRRGSANAKPHAV